MPSFTRVSVTSAVVLAICVSCAVAKAGDTAADATEQELAKYREMINDPLANPAYFNVDRGAALWTLKRGAKGLSFEGCDLGEGPGKLEGAYARLPRYFADAGRVMDLEQRLLWCMEQVQGLETADVIARRFAGPGVTSDMEDLAAFIANKSNGMRIEAQASRREEQELARVGGELFRRRAGPLDFSCATCHGEDGKRIRLQTLPNMSKAGKDAQGAVGTWPAYRVSQSQTRTLQHRLWDCYKQMRMPEPAYASEGITALELYLMGLGDGGTIEAPSIKR